MTATIPKEIQGTIEYLRKDSAEKAARGNQMLAEAQGLLRESQQKMRLADEIEVTFGINRRSIADALVASANGTSPGMNGVSGHKPNSGVTIEQIREYLKRNGARADHLAKHFGVPAERIKELVGAPDSGIEVQPRGWMKLLLL